MTPEGKLKNKVKEKLDSLGLWRAGSRQPEITTGWYYMPVSNGMGVHGIPDFVGVYKGRFFSIETKAPGGSPTANQLQRQTEIRAGGGIAEVIYDVSELNFLTG